MDKGAVEFLVNECSKANVLQVDGRPYSDKPLQSVLEPGAALLQVASLTALVDYLQANFDDRSKPVLVHVMNPTKVVLRGVEGGTYRQRDHYMTADCEDLLPDMNGRYFGKFVDNEVFQIWLRTGFADVEQRAEIAKLASSVKMEAKQTVDDDGVKQQVTVQNGVTMLGKNDVPNPVLLAPYRTFFEVEQPASEFLFRVHAGGEFMLAESDGGMWRKEAVGRIKEWLTEQLKDVETPAITIIC